MGWAPGALEEIRRRCDLVTLVSQVVELRPRGRHLVGLCPFHPERTPSFYVTPERQLFRCFGCNAAGDVFSFVMRREGLSFAEAVEALARRVGVELRPATAAERRRRALRDRYIEALTAAAEEYRRAALGVEVEVPVLAPPGEGPAVERVAVPGGTQPGDLLRMRGFGLPRSRGGGRGDLLVRVSVETPRQLSEEERELLRQLARLRGEPVEGESMRAGHGRPGQGGRGFLGRMRDALGNR